MIPLKRDSDDNYDHCTVIQVPGFTDLTLNDQMKLLQSSWTEVAQLFTNLSVIPTRSNSFWLYNTHLVTTCQRVRRNTCNNKICATNNDWNGKSWQVLTLTLVYRSLPKLGSLNFATDFSLSQVQVGFFKEMSCNDLDYHRPTVRVVA